MVTINCSTHPNHLHLGSDVTVGASFGALLSVMPVYYPGEGHRPFLIARFAYGLRMELCPATAAELARLLTESLAALPLTRVDDIRDAAGGAP